MAAKPNPKDAEAQNQPVKRLHVGTVQASIWENKGEKGPFYTATIQNSFQDAAGKWHTSNSYGPRDLVHLAKAALLADSEIVKLKQGNDNSAGDPGPEA